MKPGSAILNHAFRVYKQFVLLYAPRIILIPLGLSTTMEKPGHPILTLCYL